MQGHHFELNIELLGVHGRAVRPLDLLYGRGLCGCYSAQQTCSHARLTDFLSHLERVQQGQLQQYQRVPLPFWLGWAVYCLDRSTLAAVSGTCYSESSLAVLDLTRSGEWNAVYVMAVYETGEERGPCKALHDGLGQAIFHLYKKTWVL